MAKDKLDFLLLEKETKEYGGSQEGETPTRVTYIQSVHVVLYGISRRDTFTLVSSR